MGKPRHKKPLTARQKERARRREKHNIATKKRFEKGMHLAEPDPNPLPPASSPPPRRARPGDAFEQLLGVSREEAAMNGVALLMGMQQMRREERARRKREAGE